MSSSSFLPFNYKNTSISNSGLLPFNYARIPNVVVGCNHSIIQEYKNTSISRVELIRLPVSRGSPPPYF